MLLGRHIVPMKLPLIQNQRFSVNNWSSDRNYANLSITKMNEALGIYLVVFHTQLAPNETNSIKQRCRFVFLNRTAI